MQAKQFAFYAGQKLYTFTPFSEESWYAVWIITPNAVLIQTIVNGAQAEYGDEQFPQISSLTLWVGAWRGN